MERRHPTPSITKQTSWECAFFNLPHRPKTTYFNPAITFHHNTLTLFTRRSRRMGQLEINDLTAWSLDATLAPLTETPIKIRQTHPTDNWEDPRVFQHHDKLYLSWAGYRRPFLIPHYVHQAFGVLNQRLSVEQPQQVNYGGNKCHPLLATAMEKNWCWFSCLDKLHFVYSPNPHIVVRMAPGGVVDRDWQTEPFRWAYGSPRGGTSPILHEDLYWTFFHSSLELGNKPPRRRYYMGAYAFQSTPPFQPVGYTPQPLLIGSEEDPIDPKAPLCVFPCGALLQANEWLVTFGVNDNACAWIKIPHANLRDKMIQV